MFIKRLFIGRAAKLLLIDSSLSLGGEQVLEATLHLLASGSVQCNVNVLHQGVHLRETNGSFPVCGQWLARKRSPGTR